MHIFYSCSPNHGSFTQPPQEARGGVLFIDEAYDFASNQFGKEALAVLCDAMTKPDYSKTVVIMAGYPENMRCVYLGIPARP
jgi:hypothetical protein